jgi:hypothetical protein
VTNLIKKSAIPIEKPILKSPSTVAAISEVIHDE